MKLKHKIANSNGVTKPLEANYNESNTDVFLLFNTVQEQATAKETSADPV